MSERKELNQLRGNRWRYWDSDPDYPNHSDHDRGAGEYQKLHGRYKKR